MHDITTIEEEQAAVELERRVLSSTIPSGSLPESAREYADKELNGMRE